MGTLAFLPLRSQVDESNLGKAGVPQVDVTWGGHSAGNPHSTEGPQLNLWASTWNHPWRLYTLVVLFFLFITEKHSFPMSLVLGTDGGSWTYFLAAKPSCSMARQLRSDPWAHQSFER